MIETTFVKGIALTLCTMYDDGWEFLEDIKRGNADRLTETILEYLRMD